MDSKEEEEENTTTTQAIDKKRSRRVSFAETTAIHLFIRDENCENNSNSNDNVNAPIQRTASDEIRDLLSSSDDDDDDDASAEADVSFLRPPPFESPSSGSCFGSTNSINEDNFFGPVSADFIKPGRLSDSAVSDDNHDVTMDSTAFSMHFRSLARSDCGEFKTPTAMHKTSGERSLDQISNTSADLMVLSASRKRVAGSAFCADIVNDSGNSDDMSVVGEKPHRYDYGELPPELNNLLVGDDKDTSAGSGLRQNGFELPDISNRDIDANQISATKKASDSAAFANPIDNENNNIPGPLSNDQAKSPFFPTNVMQVDKYGETRKGAADFSRNLLLCQDS